MGLFWIMSTILDSLRTLFPMHHINFIFTRSNFPVVEWNRFRSVQLCKKKGKKSLSSDF